MKKALASLCFLVLMTGLIGQSSRVSAASSDDFTGNYAKRDPEDYNFLPLVLDPGKSTGNTGSLRDRISYNMVYDQGYEVQCAKPDWNITPQVYGAIEDYFKTYSAPVTLSSDAQYNVDFSAGKIPLFQGDEALTDTTKVSSFEGYFGANSLKDVPPKTNSTGVANLLLNQDGQCAAKYQNLKSIFGDGALCSKLKDPSQCALSRDIANGSFTTEKLYSTLTGLFNMTNSEGKNLSCSDITGGWNEDLTDFGLTESKFNSDVQPAVDALTNMPLNLDILYRLAFLIISPKQNPATGNDVFSFLQNKSPEPNAASHATINNERHAPIVIAFKVPFTATNSIYSLPNLRDSALLSAYAIRGIDSLQQEDERINLDRTDFINTIIANKQTKPIINCDGMPQCAGSGDSQALFQALIDIVNGSEQSCSSFKGPYENAGDLGSPATVSEDKESQSPYFSEVLPITNSAGFAWSLKVADANINSIAKQEKVPVSAHIVAPYGTNLEYLTGSLKSLFTTEQFAKLVENNCITDFNGECGLIPEYFTFGGITADLDSGSDSFSFGSNADCALLTNPSDIAKCKKESFGATTTEQPREPIRILGASVGWMIQKIQETFRGVGSKAAEYIQNCKRTEDLFLGRCLGYQGKPGGSDSSVANSCNDYQGIQVDLPSDFTALKKLVCSTAHNNANDAQLLWGLTQVEGHPMNDAIRAGKKSIACADLIINSCGASQITGVIVPQCVDVAACPGASFTQEDGAAGQAYRDSITTDVACSVQGQLEFALQQRKGQIAELQVAYRSKWGGDPTTQQLYYMMAGKNYGLPVDQLTSPACAGAPAVSGCGDANYCQCVMDTFKISCN